MTTKHGALKHTKRARRRHLGSPPEVHAENFEQQHQGARESIDHARDAIRRGDCSGALDDLVDSARHVGATAGEAVASGLRSTSSDMSRRLRALRAELANASSAFAASCVRSRRK